jgi:hypothetical protein
MVIRVVYHYSFSWLPRPVYRPRAVAVCYVRRG